VISVRVRFYRSHGGWSYEVFVAEGALTWLGCGWSAGGKRCAVESFHAQAMTMGWTERSVRSERMRGAA
jgi:hypothetical protein